MSTFETYKSRFSHGMYCANRFLMEIVFMDFGIDFCCFLEALGAAFLVVWALKTSLKINGFCDDAD